MILCVCVDRLQADYHSLIGITADLVDALESTVQGKPVSVVDMLTDCAWCASLSFDLGVSHLLGSFVFWMTPFFSWQHLIFRSSHIELGLCVIFEV